MYYIFLPLLHAAILFYLSVAFCWVPRILVIGAGINGLFSAFYLSASGYDVVLVDRGDILSGTSGRFHGMLHSGARYAVNDPKSAKECASESEFLFRAAPSMIDDTGGYFIALSAKEEDYGDSLLKACKECNVSATDYEVSELLDENPFINHNVKRAIRVPDRVIHGYEFGISVAALASLNGAKIRSFEGVSGIEFTRKEAVVSFRNYRGREHKDRFDFVLNTTGPYASSILEMAGLNDVEVMPTLGTMICFRGTYTSSILNRMRLPSDGDIVVPYGCETIGGTQAVVTVNPDSPEIDPEELEEMRNELANMVPILARKTFERYYYSIRPLIRSGDLDPRQASRDFYIFDHSSNHKLPMISVLGGKFTTARLVGFETASKVSEALGGGSIKLAELRLDTAVDSLMESLGTIEKELLEVSKARIGTMDDRLSRETKFLLCASSFISRE